MKNEIIKIVSDLLTNTKLNTNSFVNNFNHIAEIFEKANDLSTDEYKPFIDSFDNLVCVFCFLPKMEKTVIIEPIEKPYRYCDIPDYYTEMVKVATDIDYSYNLGVSQLNELQEISEAEAQILENEGEEALLRYNNKI